MNPNQASQRAHEVLEYVGLKDQRYREIETFSTGMLQATKLACALVHDPEILICDEPTNGLDPNQIRRFRELIKQLGIRHTILISTHDLSHVRDFCDLVVLINKTVLAYGDTSEVFTSENLSMTFGGMHPDPISGSTSAGEYKQ
mgnify:CR=1 FL=1